MNKLRLIYLVTLIVSACSMAYELLIAHALSLVASGAVTWYSLVVGVYLGSMGIGAMFSNKIFKKSALLERFLKIEMLLGIFGGMAAMAIYFLRMLNIYVLMHYSSFQGSLVVFFTGAFLVTSLVGFLTGIELPLLIKIARALSGKNITNRVLGVSYIGGLTGALIFSLVMVPSLNVIMIGLIIALVNVIVVFFVHFLLLKRKYLSTTSVVAAMVVVVIFWGIYKSAKIENYFAKKYYNYPATVQNLNTLLKPIENEYEIERFNSAYQEIDIVDDSWSDSTNILLDAYSNKFFVEPDFPERKTIFINGDWQTSSESEEVYHEYFTHVPIILAKKVPEKVLILGGGDGLLLRELVKYNSIEEIVLVELDQKMIDLAKNHQVLRRMNHNSLYDERVRVLIQDGFTYLKNTKEKFDAILMDFPTPVDYNTSRLYSREIYTFAKKALDKGGFLIFDAPGSAVFTKKNALGEQRLSEKSDWKKYYHTLKSAEFGTIIPFVSNLEVDNSRAQNLAVDLLKEAEGDDFTNLSLRNKQKRVLEFVRSRATDFQQGFVFAMKEKVDKKENFSV